MKYDLTKGSVLKNLLRFSIPYLVACFLQTFYGLADLFMIGRLGGDAASTTGVSVGSQITHMLTVIIAGLAMGTTVSIASSVGAGNKKAISRAVGSSIVLFSIFAVIATALLMLFTDPILQILSTPKEALSETRSYVLICFAGIVFITAYNVISSIFRGMGDTRSPLIFVFIAGIINIVLDYIFIGPLDKHAAGAALATVISQAASVIISVIFLIKKKEFSLSLRDLIPERLSACRILGIGAPIACQDGLIQIAFLVITAIANARGVQSAAGVGIVEKVITFLFLVPSAFLSATSAIGAQNAGAGKHERSFKTLKASILICVIYGVVAVILCEIFTENIVAAFTKDPEVVALGATYLRSYAFDVCLAGIHFCLSGFFCAYGKPLYSFISNIAAIIAIRIPGAYLASVFFKDTLFPMGCAAPAGSLLSACISLLLFVHLKRLIDHRVKF